VAVWAACPEWAAWEWSKKTPFLFLFDLHQTKLFHHCRLVVEKLLLDNLAVLPVGDRAELY
jgi:hypothetical protein